MKETLFRLMNDAWLDRIAAVECVLVLVLPFLHPDSAAETVAVWLGVGLLALFVSRFLWLLLHRRPKPLSREMRRAALRRSRFYSVFGGVWFVVLLVWCLIKW